VKPHHVTWNSPTTTTISSSGDSTEEPAYDLLLQWTDPELVAAVVGTGVVRYPEAARRAGVETCFIERDPFFRRRPVMEMLVDDLAALRRLLGVAPLRSAPV
jgi:hypothetical protein